MSFTTAEDVALFLNREFIDLSPLELAQINLLLPCMDGIINSHCGWNMLSTDYVDERYDGTGTNTLDLRRDPVNSITQIRVREIDGSFTDVTDGVEILKGGLIQFLPYATSAVTTFATGTMNVFVTFNAGYEDGAVPYELSYAANYLVALHYNKVTAENIGSDDEKFGEVTFKNTELVIPKPVTHLLDRFRLVSVF